MHAYILNFVVSSCEMSYASVELTLTHYALYRHLKAMAIGHPWNSICILPNDSVHLYIGMKHSTSVCARAPISSAYFHSNHWRCHSRAKEKLDKLFH